MIGLLFWLKRIELLSAETIIFKEILILLVMRFYFKALLIIIILYFSSTKGFGQKISFKRDTIMVNGKPYAILKEKTIIIYGPTIFKKSEKWLKKKLQIADSSEILSEYQRAEISKISTPFRKHFRILNYELFTLDSTNIASTSSFFVSFQELDTRSEFFSFYYKITEPFKVRFANDQVKFDVLRSNRLNKKGLKMLVGQSDVNLSSTFHGWCGTGGPIFISGYGGTYTNHDSIFSSFDKYRNIGKYKIHELLNDTTILSFEIHDWTGEPLAKAYLNRKDLSSCSILTYPDNKLYTITVKRYSMNYFDGKFKRNDYGGIIEQVSSFLIRDKYF